MVLIFGWGGGPVDDRGEVAPVRCPNCHNDVYFHQIHSTQQVSLFFVPVMPYGTDEYLVCPVCGHGLEIPLQHQSAVHAMRRDHGGIPRRSSPRTRLPRPDRCLLAVDG